MKKPVITLLHVGYWVVYLFLMVIILLCLSLGSNLKAHPLFFNLKFDIFFAAFAVVPGITGFYSFYAILFSRLLAKKRILLFFIAAVAISFLCGVFGSFVLTLLAWYHIGVGVFAGGISSALSITIALSIIAMLNGVVGLVMKGFISWYDDIKLKEELNKKNHETELALVKSQLDPHFLFNTINNIDVLIEKNATTASLYLNRLSDIMRFMLYETKPEYIPLQTELAYIEKYIALQKIRSNNPNYVKYTVNQQQHSLMIKPMLFIPFIENAFKHAADRKTENVINISFEICDDAILFKCENACDPQFKKEHTGLGNDLIKKRLQLLYPGKHKLEISNTVDAYQVKLNVTCL
jgi:sensor histidine kinase YesM